MKFFKPFVLFLLFFVLSFSMLMPIPQANAQTAPDTGGLGECAGLGADFSRPDAADINPAVSDASSYTVTVLSRSQIFVQASASAASERFFASGAGPSLGEIFGDGCTLTDADLNDEFTYTTGAVSIAPPDSFRTQSRTSNNRNLGIITPSGDLAMGLIFIFEGDELSFTPITLSIPIASVRNADMFNHIFQVSGTDQQLTLTGGGTENVDVFQGQGPLYIDAANTGSDCITFPSGGSATALLADTDWYDGMQYDQNCDGDPIDIRVRGGAAPTSAETAGLPAGVLDAEGATGSTSCEERLNLAFNFILCALLIGANGVIGWVDDRIISSLSVENNYFNNAGIKNAWGNMRNIAYIVLIPVMLVMVIGTALGFGFLDAYTVRRTVPRLFIAAIFISLSFDICRILIEITNGVGRGTAGIIASPFGGMDNLTLTHIFSPGRGSGIVVNAVVLGLLFGGVVSNRTTGTRDFNTGAFDRLSDRVESFGLAGLSLTLGIAALILLAIFGLLALREMMIVFLLVISPLAILAWIFPGNDKPWKLWWGTFSKLLYLFPIITGFIAVGRAFAMVIGDAGNADPVLGTFVKLIAVIGPYFFIPRAFQMAGGAFANIAGMVNNREKGLLDRMRNRRAEGIKSRRERQAKGEAPYRGGTGNNLRGRLNTRAQERYLRRQEREKHGWAATLNEERRQSIHDAEHAALVNSEREHILKEDGDNEFMGYDDLTGLAAAVRMGDWGTLRQAYIHKYGLTAVQADAAIADAQRMRAAGNMRGALTRAFEAADSGTGDNAFNSANDGGEFLRQSVEQMMALDRKYNTAGDALNQALVLKAAGGGTFYRDADAAWFAANASTTTAHGRDRNAVAKMNVALRQALMATGRADSGGISFGAGMGIDNDIERGMEAIAAGRTYDIDMGGGVIETVHNEDELRRHVGRKVVRTAKEQNGAAVFAHQSMKTGNMDLINNVIEVMRDDIQYAYDTFGADSQEYKAEIANAESLHKSLQQTKPEAAKLFGDRVLAYDVGIRDSQDAATQTEWHRYEQANTARERLEATLKDTLRKGDMFLPDGQAAPSIPTTPSGNLDQIAIEAWLNSQITLPPVPTSSRPRTVRMETGRFQSDPVYQNYAYQFTQAEQALAQSAAAAAAAVGGGPATGTPTPPPIGGVPSDARLKTDIRYINTIDGVPMYSFRYVWSGQIYIGTIAQEVMDINPDAVVKGENGFLTVDYSLLPFDMMTIEEYFTSTKQKQINTF